MDLTCRNLAALAENFTDAGFVVLIDCVIPDGTHLQRLLALLSGRSAAIVVLAPSAGTCGRRNATRAANERFDFDGYEQLEQSMRTGFGDVGWWFDTSELSADATAEAIAERLGLADEQSQ